MDAITPSGEESEALHVGMQGYLNADFLAHHGILGQKWGVRRFQDKNGHLTPEGKKRYSKDGVSTNDRETKTGLFLELQVATTAVIVTSAAVITAVEHHNKKLGDKLLDKKGIADTSKTFSDKEPPRKIEGEHSAEDDMSKVNDLYSSMRPQTQNNCVHCSLTMELRRRGFDVCARTSSEPIVSEEAINKVFKPTPKKDDLVWPDRPKDYAKMSNEERSAAFNKAKQEGKIAVNYKTVEQNILKKYPDGARGLFSAINPAIMVGHAMAFEVKGGKVIIYDTQTNKSFRLSSPPEGFAESLKPWTSTAVRLDDKKIDWNGANSICAERIKKG